MGSLTDPPEFQDDVQNFCKLGQRIWLRDEGVCTKIMRSPYVARHGRRAYNHDRSKPVRLAATQPFEEFHPVAPRHVKVRKNKVRCRIDFGIVKGGLVLEGGNGLKTVSNSSELHGSARLLKGVAKEKFVVV